MATVQDLREEAVRVLKNRFGLASFKAGQQAVIDALLAGRSAAAIFPTGGGKSLCYQLPSQLLPGTTLVVSPLIALMKDQCDALNRRGIAAARLDNSQSVDELRETMDAVRDGRTKLLFVAPERFFNERFRAAIGDLKIDLFAIDEAHCISQWGHSFRPDYLKLARIAEDLRVGRVLALTATATEPVLEDICTAFDIDRRDAVQTPFYRSNLELRSCVIDASQRVDTLRQRLATRPRGATICYVTKQRTSEEIADALESAGFAARAYHAGLANELRAEVQQWFLEQPDRIVVATIAFGMGIDKADIRYVYHLNPPKSLEAYAQEIGRAGRDGEDATCELFLVPEDRVALENFAYGDTPDRDSIDRLLELITGQPPEFFISHYKLSSATNMRLSVVRTLLTYLELDGYLIGTSPRYDSYRFKPRVTSQQILRNLPESKRGFVRDLLATSVRAKTWFSIPLAVAARRLAVPRERIVRAIDYLADRGWLEVRVAELVHGYRHQRPIGDPGELAGHYDRRFREREASEIQRLDEVFELARAESCLAARLSAHFGERLQQTCGRCSACRGDGPFTIDFQPNQRSIGRGAKRIIETLRREYPALLGTPRAQARFLCGLSSPAFIAKKLTRHASYGVCDGLPLAAVEAELRNA